MQGIMNADMYQEESKDDTNNIQEKTGPNKSGSLSEDELMRAIWINPETGNSLMYDQIMSLKDTFMAILKR